MAVFVTVIFLIIGVLNHGAVCDDDDDDGGIDFDDDFYEYYGQSKVTSDQTGSQYIYVVQTTDENDEESNVQYVLQNNGQFSGQPVVPTTDENGDQTNVQYVLQSNGQYPLQATVGQSSDSSQSIFQTTGQSSPSVKSNVKNLGRSSQSSIQYVKESHVHVGQNTQPSDERRTAVTVQPSQSVKSDAQFLSDPGFRFEDLPSMAAQSSILGQPSLPNSKFDDQLGLSSQNNVFGQSSIKFDDQTSVSTTPTFSTQTGMPSIEYDDRSNLQVRTGFPGQPTLPNVEFEEKSDLPAQSSFLGSSSLQSIRFDDQPEFLTKSSMFSQSSIPNFKFDDLPLLSAQTSVFSQSGLRNSNFYDKSGQPADPKIFGHPILPNKQGLPGQSSVFDQQSPQNLKSDDQPSIQPQSSILGQSHVLNMNFDDQPSINAQSNVLGQTGLPYIKFDEEPSLQTPSIVSTQLNLPNVNFDDQPSINAHSNVFGQKGLPYTKFDEKPSLQVPSSVSTHLNLPNVKFDDQPNLNAQPSMHVPSSVLEQLNLPSIEFNDQILQNSQSNGFGQSNMHLNFDDKSNPSVQSSVASGRSSQHYANQRRAHEIAQSRFVDTEGGHSGESSEESDDDYDGNLDQLTVYPGRGSNSKKKYGTTVEPSFSVEAPGMCNDYKTKGGWAYRPIYGSCNQYLQCNSDHKAFLLTCAAGTFYDGTSCSHSSEVYCPFDPCQVRHPGFKYTDGQSCYGFYECVKGQSLYQTCSSGYYFNSNKQTCIPDVTCQKNNLIHPCSYGTTYPFPGRPELFYLYDGRKIFYPMKCPKGLWYRPDICSCDWIVPGIGGKEGCKPMFHFQYNGNFLEAYNRIQQVPNTGVAIYRKSALFSEGGQIMVWAMNNMDLDKEFAFCFEFMVKIYTGEVALLSNGYKKNAFTYKITYFPGQSLVKAYIELDDDTTAHLVVKGVHPLKPHFVRLAKFGRKIKLRIDNLKVAMVTTRANVPASRSPLVIGAADDCKGFVGHFDEFKFFKCVPKDFFNDYDEKKKR